ncbi:MAG: hypothetical protein EA427_09415 [Spirochaetaceae bacterium]|nr:MAG: hypothetical protein EA427_09415 [Spirochaetaceae bacterium]
MTRKALLIAGLLVSLLVLIALTVGFVPRTMRIPDYLHGTPVEDDIRREIRRSRRIVFIPGPDTERFRGAIYFPAAPSGTGEPADRSGRVGLVPGGNRESAVEEALEWLVRTGREPVVLAYDPASFPNDPGELGPLARGAAVTVRLERTGETEPAVQRIRSALGDDPGRSGLVLLAGEHTPAITAALLSGDRTATIHLVPELFLVTTGARMRSLGVPLAGVLAPDLAGALRKLPIRLGGVDDIHVPLVFFRY